MSLLNISINMIAKASNEDWDNALKACPHSTYFHSREWSEIWQKYAGLVPQAKQIEFSDGRRVILPSSYFCTLKGIIKNVLMSPAGTYGGALYDGEITVNHLGLIFHEVKKYSSVAWRQNPFEPLIQDLWPSDSKEDSTHALDLRIGFKKIFKSWTKGHRSAVSKAAKAGCRVRKAQSRKDWKEYFKSYEDSLIRWGSKASSKYRWEFLDLIYNTMSPNVTLWIAEFDEQLTSGALCFYQNNHVVYWHGATYKKYFNLRPVNLLLYEIIKDAYESGYTWFDFSPSGGHKGVANFKKHFGCSTYKSNVYYHRSAKDRILQRIRRFFG